MKLLIALLIGFAAHASDTKVYELLQLNKQRLMLTEQLTDIQAASLAAFGSPKYEELNRQHTLVANKLRQLNYRIQNLQFELVD